MTLQTSRFPGPRLILALVALLLVRLAFAANIPFIEDEAYYRLWGLYPAYAYFDHAPMVGWWIALSQHLIGDQLLGVRLFSPIAGFIGALLVWRIAVLTFDRRTADYAVIILNAMPLMGIGSVLMTPDVPSVLFWTFGLWTLVEWNQSRRNAWWLAFGLAAGLGLLSKYSNVFLGFGALLWLLWSGLWHTAVRSACFWIAGLLATLLFSPVVYWNMTHQWVSFAKQLGRLQADGVTFFYLVDWIGGQFLMASPIIFIMTGLAFAQVIKSQPDKSSSVSIVVTTTLPMLIYFFYHSWTSRINANWTAPLYPNFAILAGFSLKAYLNDPRPAWITMTRLAAPIGMLLIFAVLIEAWHPYLPTIRKNPIEQIRGYDDFAVALAAEQKKINAVAVVTTRYQLTGMLSYALRDQTSVIQLTERIRYFNMPAPDPAIFAGRVIYVAAENEARSFIQNARSCFEDAERIGTYIRRDRGIELGTYELWAIDGLRPSIFDAATSPHC